MKMHRIWRRLLTTAVCALAAAGYAAAYTGYDNYTYSNRDMSIMPAPDAYLPGRVIYGDALGAGTFRAPEDICTGPDGRLYILDSGNSRVVVLNREYALEAVLPMQDGEGVALTGTKGLFVAGDGRIYVADPEGRRVVVLDTGGKVSQVYAAPCSEILPDDFLFKPVKIAADDEGMMYVVSEGTYEGILTLDETGAFNGFIGANPVKPTPWEIFWKSIATRAQKDAMLQFIPVDHSSLDISADNFIYCTTKTVQNGKSVKLLNPGGTDILKEMSNVPIAGDPIHYWYGDLKGSSVFADIACDTAGIYACLDATRGKVFCYSDDGYLLYVFGALGGGDGMFKAPAAVTFHGDNAVVLDKERASVTVFQPTRYAALIREAAGLQRELEFDKAAEKWNDVLRLNENFELAHIAIGKIAMNAGDNAAAMENFLKGNSKSLYSKALEGYRTQWIYRNLIWVLAAAAGLALLLAARAVWVRVRKKEAAWRVPPAVRYPFHVAVHPFRGFWGIKGEGKGSLRTAFILMALLLATLVFRVYNTGYLLTTITADEFSFVQLVLVVALVYLLFCVANWSLTTLMGGEGRFKEILMVAAYSMLPIIVVNIPLTLLSNVLTNNEIPFYTFFSGVAIAWSAALLLVGCMTVHNYSMGKTVAVAVLTVLVMLIIAVLAVLFFNLLQQVYIFLSSLVLELRFRM